MNDWREVLNELLKSNTERALAKKVGVSQGHISHLRLGRRNKPSYDLVRKIFEVYENEKTVSGH